MNPELLRVGVLLPDEAKYCNTGGSGFAMSVRDEYVLLTNITDKIYIRFMSILVSVYKMGRKLIISTAGASHTVLS